MPCLKFMSFGSSHAERWGQEGQLLPLPFSKGVEGVEGARSALLYSINSFP